MPNPKATGGTHELQERYANMIVKLMRPYLKIRNTFSRDYEGNPTAGAVKVPVRNLEVEVQNYNVKNGVDLTQSQTTYLNILVDQEKAVNELIDGYEAAAVPDNLVAQRLDSAAYSMAVVYEAHALSELKKGVASTMPDCTTSNVYANIVNDVANLAKKGIDKNRMYIAIDYSTETMLLTDEKYSNTCSQIGADLAREGVVGRINGVNVKTQDLGTKNGGVVQYIIYGVDWAQAIDEWLVKPAVKDLNDGKHIGASALQGRSVYTDKLTDTNAAIVKTAAASL